LTLGFYRNFPATIHRIETFTSSAPTRQLQQKLIQVLHDINQREFCFEEISIPTVPNGTVIFEFGLAEEEGFNFIDGEELKRALSFLSKERVAQMDFFCSIRCYKGNGDKKTALKFDYYMLRTLYGKDVMEMQVFHERGPRYIAPEDLTAFISAKVNEGQKRKILTAAQ
jgi:hypothetical protein